MKRLFPAIALLFVVALSSFTTSSPAQAEKKKTFNDFHKYVGGELVPSDIEEVEELCIGDENVCAVDILDGGSVGAAESYIENPANQPFVFPGAGLPIHVNDFDPAAGQQAMDIYPLN